jgi:oligopeptidase B
LDLDVSTTLPKTETTAQPPVARKEPRTTEIHGLKLSDDYFWMRDKANPEVRAYLEAENAYTDALMRPTEALQGRLYDEMLARIKETDVQVPYREGDYFYYSRTEQGKQYPIFCRKPGSTDAPEQITLDLNALAEGQSFMALGAYAVSPNGRLLAYSTDNTGFRQYTLQIKDLESGAVLPDRMEKTGSIAWAADNRTLFYTVEDAAKRHYRLYRHRLGSAVAQDALVFEERDERFELAVFKSRSRQFIFLESGSHTTSEARFLRADQPDNEFQLIEPRRQEVEYYPDHHGNFFYLRVNDTGRNYRVVRTPVAAAGRENWQEVVAHSDQVMLEDLQLFRDFYVLTEREDGLPHLRIVDLAAGGAQRVPFPEAAYSIWPEPNREFATTAYRYRYQSFITPPSVYEYDVRQNTSTLLKRTEVLGGYDPSRYQVERRFAVAPDGVRVPISLVYLKTLRKDGTAPLYLYAYGSYGIPQNVTFNSNRYSLIDRGVVFAIAHIRGGGDLGKAWHDAGKMMNKMNTFTDFIAAAEFLTSPIQTHGNDGERASAYAAGKPIQYGDRRKLVIEGGSAGGLLMGAVANLRPELFNAVIAKVPFVDVINTMLDESLPLTVGEFEEWGNPKERKAFAYMVRYSPYDNLESKSYPAMLIKTAFNDSQVMYWEPAKYVAKLRTLKTDQNPLLLKTNMGAGHGGASGRYDYLREVAFDYAFVLRQVGQDD